MSKVELRRVENGDIIYHLSPTESNADWLNAARLKKRAEEGDKMAREEFEKMDSNPMVIV